MSRGFSFAVQTGPFADPDALRGHARMVEDLGYRELFSFDHVGAVDPYLPLMVAAEATSTLRFGPLVLNNELHNPVLVARTAATFDALSGGRLVLGLGTGYAQSEHDAIDLPLRPPGARVARFGESVAVLRRLLDDGAVALQGEHVRVAVDDLGVRPAADRVPFLIGGYGRRVVAVAADHADIFQLTGIAHDPATGEPRTDGFTLAAARERITWLREAAGERAPAIEVSALVQVIAVGDDVGARAQAIADEMEIDRALLDETPFVLVGSVAQVVEKLHRLHEQLGLTHVVIRSPRELAPVVDALA
jgi:probable F420-dependent oxidoreductase